VADRPISPDEQRSTPPSDRRWVLVLIGLVVFHLSLLLPGHEKQVWLPAVGLGLALVAWTGLWAALPLAADFFVVRGLVTENWALAFFEAVLLGGQLAGSWWCYRYVANGTRRLEDPRSATLFLILVPGGVAGLAGLAEALAYAAVGPAEPAELAFWTRAALEWIVRALGILVLVPLLLTLLSPLLVRLGMATPDPVVKQPGGMHPTDWTLGELVEVLGLTAGAIVLSTVLAILQSHHVPVNLHLWGFTLLLIVWTGLRQGLRGGALAAGASAGVALALVGFLGGQGKDAGPFQGIMMAQCSVALLVGASAGWIRASEARYRQVVGHIPVVLYSVRLPRGTPAPTPRKPLGPTLLQAAEVTLVSPASRVVFEAEPNDLLGSYAAWTERIVTEDRELVIASLAQLSLQKQPVTCEYRLMVKKGTGTVSSGEARPDTGVNPLLPTPLARPSHERWVRETMVPQYDGNDKLAGWEGVVEDITAQRHLAHDLRVTGGMLQALVTNLPTGVFFVQGPNGRVLLMNARAKKLLGQRESFAPGLQHIPRSYRLYRLDGSEYPWEELPVCRALQQGITCMVNDMVVHRPDGRRVPLVSWAAPVDLQGFGQADAAVWVLEDLTALQQAESARLETEQRLRVLLENLAEGVIVLNAQGTIIESNPAAGRILGVPADKLRGRTFLCPEQGCLRNDGSDFPAEEQPDRLALRTSKPLRNVVLGMPTPPPDNGHRWLLVNAMPLPPLNSAIHPGRLVVSFSDVTEQRKSLEDMQRAQRLELMGRLAGGTIHDFNNLLTVMTGVAELARANLPSEHAVAADLGRIMEAGEQAGRLAGQLLAFSKPRRHVSQPVDLNGVVGHTMSLLERVLPANITIQTTLARDATVRADETQLKQVMMNLCLNARDAMPSGGVLALRTEVVHDTSPSSANGGPPSAWVKLTVLDSGVGMDEAMKAKLFEPFYTTKERGTGLGLPVVKQIVESYNGRVAVVSQPGQGTSMILWLPAATG
jgi:signal transduction histidine kinase